MIHQGGIPYHGVVWYRQEYVLVAAEEMIRSSAFMCPEIVLRDHKKDFLLDLKIGGEPTVTQQFILLFYGTLGQFKLIHLITHFAQLMDQQEMFSPG